MTPGQRSALDLIIRMERTPTGRAFVRPYKAQERTLFALRDLGYVQVRIFPSGVAARSRPAGRAALQT